MTITELYQLYLQFPSVQTDTRKIKNGDIFFALKGPNFNANNFAQTALDAGAAYCVCDEPQNTNPNKIILVPNVLETLQNLAKHHREQLNIPFIAITGSNGKTTTKELVHAVLNTQLKCYTTVGNLNNHIGVPLTILSIKNDAQIAVVEMGANHLHEIESYCTYTQPTHGLIVNCGKAHLEGFGGEEGVKKAKGELYNYIATTNGTIFINTDYNYLHAMSSQVKNKITYGTSNATYAGHVLSQQQYLHVAITSGAAIPILQTQLAGNYNLPNILSAVCIGKTFGITDTNIKNAIENYTPSNSRSQVIQIGTNTILLDAYNANPSSMKAAIENFAAMQGTNKIVILGAMMELGNQSIEEHISIVKLLTKYPWTKIVLVGTDYTNLPNTVQHFATSDEAAAWFKTQPFTNTQILIKGSRSMAMEKLLA